MIAAAPNLWDPAHLTAVAALVTAFLLGVVHGITPDEHTWPITFSYAIGSYSSRRGLRAGLLFSAAFTAQRALTSELAWLGLTAVFTIGWVDNAVYVVVGVLMALGGALIVRGGHPLHLHLPRRLRRRPAQPATAGDRAGSSPSGPDARLSDPRPWMPLVHGFVAGWGFGAFALIIYTVLAPAMPSAALGWVPGAVFGAGTTLVQAAAGAAFGWLSARYGLSPAAIRQVSLTTAGRTLAWGGWAFVIAGLFGLAFPRLAAAGLRTGLHVHNLDSIGLPLILVVVIVLGVGFGTLVTQLRGLRRVPPVVAGSEAEQAAAR